MTRHKDKHKMTNKEQILEEFDKKFDHFNDLYFGREENKKHKDVGKQICDSICEKHYDLRDVRKFLLKALSKTQQDTIEEEKEFLENIKTLFGSRYDDSAWKRISKYHKKEFISWVRETKQQDWSKKHMGESRWWRAWQLYQQEYIAFVISKRLKNYLDKLKKEQE